MSEESGLLTGTDELAVAASSTAETPATVDRRTIERRVFGLAWPVIGENLLETLLHIVDTVLVAGLGVAAIAGVGTALQVMLFVLAALGALSIGSSVLVAQAVGARDFGRASELALQSVLWSALFSIPLAVAGVLLSEPVIGLFALEPDVARVAVSYMQVSMGTVVVLAQPFWAVLFVQSGAIRGTGDTRYPLLVNGTGIWLGVGIAALLLATVGGGLISVWAAFVITAPLSAALQWRGFRSRARVIAASQH